MTNTKFITCVISILCITISCDDDDNIDRDDDCFMAEYGDTYKYPVKPGTEEWKKMNAQQIVAACQIPENLLVVISTDGLIESTLNNPLFGEIYLSSVSVQHGFNSFHEIFNGIRELFKRKDVAVRLINRYEQMDPACTDNNWPALVGPGTNNNFSFSFIEITIAQYPVLKQIIEAGEEKAFLQEVINKHEDKKTYDYSVFGLKYSALIAGRIMYLCEYEPFITEYNTNQILQRFINTAELLDYYLLDVVISYSKDFLTYSVLPS